MSTSTPALSGDTAPPARRGNGVLIATVLGSAVAFLDGTVVNVALPHIARSLDTGFASLQWVLDAYLLALGALTLVGGALGDVLGRRRMFLVGLVGFGLTSALSGAAPDAGVLIAARALQGVAGALLVPGSLSLITSSYVGDERNRAIGAWSGLAGLAGAVGPFVGGYLVDAVSWRLVFFINVPLVALAVAATLRWVPESRDDALSDRGLAALDFPGATLAVVALTALVLPLIESSAPLTVRTGLFVLAGVAALAFGVVEHRRRRPMLPLSLFRGRAFSVAQTVTFVIYGALGGAFFLLALQLQDSLGYSALEAGAATVPMTAMLLVFSPRVGILMGRTGAKVLLTIGPLVAGAGLLVLTRAVPGESYAAGVLPGLLIFATGMVLVVTPITSVALGSVDAARAGLASGVNNAVSRVAGLLAVAILPAVAGIGGGAAIPTHGFRVAVAVAGGLVILGGLVALVGLPRQPTAAGAPDSVSA